MFCMSHMLHRGQGGTIFHPFVCLELIAEVTVKLNLTWLMRDNETEKYGTQWFYKEITAWMNQICCQIMSALKKF